MKENVMNKESKDKFLLKTIICLVLLLIIFFVIGEINGQNAVYAAENEENQVLYLSDIDYIAGQSKTAWGSILKDQSSAGTKLSVKIEGSFYTFDKGMWAHASSTLVYDIREYKDQYDYFVTYMGLNQTAATSSNGVKFYVYTSVDGKTWELATEENAPITLANANARYVEINIKNANYLKLEVDSNGSNGNDHSVYADAKFVTREYLEGQKFALSIDEYDQQIKNYANKDVSDPNYELLLLQREFVNNVGSYALQRFITDSEENKETFLWLFNNLENLRLYVLGGKPDGGSYYNSLKILSQLYNATYAEISKDETGKIIYDNTPNKNLKDDFNDTQLTNNQWEPTLTKGNVYKKMAISLSLTHSTAVGYWAQISNPSNRSDALQRYRIYKYLYDNGKFVVSARQDQTPWFESLKVEEMRYVMNNITDDEELIWFNEYTQKRIDAHPNQEEKYIQPHTYIAYVWPNFQYPKFHDPEMKDYWDEWFEGIFSKYGVTYSTPGNMVYKAWMSMRNIYGTGAVCGGISKLGCHIRAAHGAPASVISQPGHAAIIYYRKDANGNGYWTIDNNINGWSQSGKTEKLNTRMPLGWGNDSYVSGWAASYIALSQEALNHNEAYEKSEKLIMLANVYSDPSEKEYYLREALKALPYNVDAWWGLIKLYQANPNTTEAQYFALAEEMAEALKAYPLPMYNLTNLLKNNLSSNEYSFAFTLLQTRILNEGKNATAQTVNVYQPSITNAVASYLLGQTDTSLASFSFDGEDKNKIVLSSRFNGTGIRWDYSLDGKNTWKEVSFSAEEEHKLLLTPEEIASITSTNDIYVHIVGANYEEKNLYKIDILDSAGLPSTLYANDWENKLIATVPQMEWKYRETDEWTSYQEVPDLTGDKDIIVRMGATGVYLASATNTTFHFTTNTDPETRKYISIDHISLHAFSTEASAQGRYARNAIDANLNTTWHSDWNGNDPNKFIVFKFDEVKNLTAIEYFPAAGGNGKILSAQVLVSTDGEEWREVVTGTNWTYANTNDVSTKVVDFDPVKAQYVKIVGKQTQNSFITARMFNLYENTTVRIVGTFSFDGENAKKIILDNDFKGQSWQYSLDGGNTWKAGTGDEHLLTDAEANQITEENKIKMRFGESQTQYTININKMAVPTITAYLNDWENRLIGVSNKTGLEWQIEGTKNWTDYTEQDPVVEGNKKLYIRTKASLNCTASDMLEYQFTDGDTATKKYIPISHLSIHGYSTQSVDTGRPFYAPNIIDGNPNTMWHTDFRYSIVGSRAFVTIKLDSSKYISALDFLQKQYKTNDPCFIKNAIVYVSENAEDWIEAGRMQNCAQTEEFKSIVFERSICGQYVKIEMEGYNMFSALSMVNLYEDTTMKKVGTFSFDGENANKIILEDEFRTSSWEYSLDGGETWKQGTPAHKTLTAQEVEQINGNDDIKIRIGQKEYVINIENSARPVINAYLNDLENRLIGMGNTDTLEWKIETNTRSAVGWTDYSLQEPVVKGDAKLLIRQKARNVFAASEIVEFQFTADNQADTRRYVPISQLEIAGFSAEDKGQNGAVANAIDGNYNTRWLNSSAGTDTQKYIIIKFDTAIYLSAMDYVPHSENGKILAGKIEGSMDGENFTDIAQISGWANNQNTKTIDLANPVQVRYVKITGTSTSYTSAKRHIGARMFNFYEDTTKREPVEVTAEVEYNISTFTNQDVVATLVNPSTDIIVTNNNGSKFYTFTEDGEFTFEFEDSLGNKGTATARVDWIRKTLPNATFTYDIADPTNKDVTVTVTFDRENVTILNNNGSNTYTFTENGEFTFEFRGPYGNEGTATANVDWICKTLPNATFTYDIEEETNQDVTVTVTFDRERVTILNNNGSNTYTFTENGEFTFEFRGPYGNEGIATARVDWIDKSTPTAGISYDIVGKTRSNVVATLVNPSTEIIVTNYSSASYTFTENGEFTFEFEDRAGNKGSTTATVNWIDREAPVGMITYDIIEATNQEVTASIRFNESNVRVTNNDEKTTHTFTENGEFTFEFEDEAGNQGTATANVTWIDKSLAKPTITYSTTNLTNQDVEAKVTFDKNNVTILNEDGKSTHTFTKNGAYEFEYEEENGNRGVALAKVTWIDKVAPQVSIDYGLIEPTNQDVTVSITFDKENVRILNNDGKNTYTFTENGTFTFNYVDEAGNAGTQNATVNWIDKIAPRASVSYNITNLTNQDVIVTLGNPSEDITITNNGGKNTYTFTKNGTFTFEYVDRAGNKGTTQASVNWIDKIAPTAVVSYGITNFTNKDVVATLSFASEEITITNNDGKNTYTFTENGEFVFEFVDKAGNKGSVEADVYWIDKINPTATVSYDITEPTEGSVTATLANESENITITNNNGSRTYTFTENGNFTFEFKDKVGNVGTATARVDWIKDKTNIPEVPDKPDVPEVPDKPDIPDKPDETVKIGDINKDGRIGPTDLAKLKLYLIGKEELDEQQQKAADINKDGRITSTDLAQLKLALIGLLEIE